MRLQPILIFLLSVAVATPAFMLPREVDFETVSVDADLRLQSVPSGRAAELLSPGDRLIRVDGSVVSDSEQLNSILRTSPQPVPVRVLRTEPTEVELGPSFLDGQVPLVLQNAYRVLSVEGAMQSENPTLDELRTRVRQSSSGIITASVVSPEQVVDGAFYRTSLGPTDKEWIAAAVALVLLLLSLFLIGTARPWMMTCLALLYSSVPYVARYLYGDGVLWSFQAAVGIAGAALSIGAIASIYTLVRNRNKPGAARRRSAGTRFDASVGEGEAAQPVGSVARVLFELQQRAPDSLEPSLVVGFNRNGVLLRLKEGRVVASAVEPELHAGLSMLAVEGGVFPRTQTIVGGKEVEPEDDPFTGLEARLKLKSAVPVEGFGHGTEAWSFAVLRANAEEEATAELVVDHSIFECVDHVDQVALHAELKSYAADALLKRLEARLAESDEELSSSAEVKTPPPKPPGPEREGAESPDIGVGDRKYLEQLKSELEMEYPLSDSSALTAEQWKEVDRLAIDSAKPYLIVGAPGVGKEFRARLIHQHSTRKDGRIAVVDCAHFPEPVVAANLLGAEDSSRLIDALAGGTLVLKSALLLSEVLLDEIVARCSSSNTRTAIIERVDAEPKRLPREIPTSLRQTVGARWMSVPSIHRVPGEILRIAARFVHEYAMRYGKEVLRFDDKAANVLEEMEFAANIHELRAICHAAVLKAEGEEINTSDLASATTGEVNEVLAEVEAADEKRRIVEALQKAEGNKSEASRMLGMSRGTLLRRLKKYNMM
jgi:DNA-binding protein Fis